MNEGISQAASDTQTESILLPKNKLPIIGFALTHAGLIFLYYFGLFIPNIKNATNGIIAERVGNIVLYPVILFPCIGLVISVISLFKWNCTGNLGRVLAIFTIIATPFYYSLGIGYVDVCKLLVFWSFIKM